ncbi:MAG: hypothetical protein ACTSPW_20535 [Promethearchaeota archaeon]
MKKKLFPKKSKGQEIDFVITELKKQIRDLRIDSKNLSKKAEIARHNAGVALKRGERERARSYLAQYKKYQQDIDSNNRTITNFEYFIRVINLGVKMQQRQKVTSLAKKILETLATQAPPDVVAANIEEAREYGMMIEEAMESTGADIELDHGIEVTDEELDKLETEILLETGGALPSAPPSEDQYITESDVEFEDIQEKTADEVKDEIKKLREELNLDE